jgi:hypothetical protein
MAKQKKPTAGPADPFSFDFGFNVRPKKAKGKKARKARKGRRGASFGS